MKPDLHYIKEQLKSRNLRITPQRIAIYRILAGSDDHPNTELIYERVRRELPNVSFNTVHQTLLTFVEHGLLKSVEGFGGVKRFDPNLVQHHHLHCQKCGKIVDFSNRNYYELTVPEEVIKDFHVTGKRVVIIGLCRNCGGKKKPVS